MHVEPGTVLPPTLACELPASPSVLWYDSSMTPTKRKMSVSSDKDLAEELERGNQPDRGELARRLLGAGRKFSPDHDAVSELVAERLADG